MVDAERVAQLSALEKRFSALEALDVAKHIRSDLEAQVSFTEFQSDFETLRDLGRLLRTFDLSALPTSVAADAVTAFDRLESLLSQVRAFSVLRVAESVRIAALLGSAEDAAPFARGV